MTIVTYRRQRLIRLARPEDRDKIVRVANQAFSPKDKTTWIDDAYQRRRTILVAERNGFIMGFVISRFEGDDTLVIDLIATVAPEVGYGRMLLAAAEARAADHYSVTRAGTHDDNLIAQDFYRSQGFLEIVP